MLNFQILPTNISSQKEKFKEQIALTMALPAIMLRS
jgi:hypothetical protein